LGIVFISCDDGNGNENNKDESFNIVGTWVSIAPADWYSFTFNSNFTFYIVYYGETETENGTYSVSGNDITLIIQGRPGQTNGQIIGNTLNFYGVSYVKH
jgi:hypothetical protein